MDARLIAYTEVDGYEMAGVGGAALLPKSRRVARSRRQQRRRRKVDGVGVKREPAQCAHCGAHFWARPGQVFCGHSCRTLNNRVKRELAPYVLVAQFADMPLVKAQEVVETFGLAHVSGVLGKFGWSWDARTKEWRQA